MTFYLDVPDVAQYHDEAFSDLRSIEIVANVCAESMRQIRAVVQEIRSKGLEGEFDLSEFIALHERNMAYLDYAVGKFADAPFMRDALYTVKGYQILYSLDNSLSVRP